MLGKPKFGVFAVSISSVFILSYFKELSDIEFVLIQRSLMYSMFDLLFETPSYRPVYVISDSEMKELKKNQHQEELDEITTQKVRLEDAFKAQLKHLEEREKEVKKELKVLSASKDKYLFLEKLLFSKTVQNRLFLILLVLKYLLNPQILKIFSIIKK